MEVLANEIRGHHRRQIWQPQARELVKAKLPVWLEVANWSHLPYVFLISENMLALDLVKYQPPYASLSKISHISWGVVTGTLTFS
jgi:hypothetical protein